MISMRYDFPATDAPLRCCHPGSHPERALPGGISGYRIVRLRDPSRRSRFGMTVQPATCDQPARCNMPANRTLRSRLAPAALAGVFAVMTLAAAGDSADQKAPTTRPAAERAAAGAQVVPEPKQVGGEPD